MVLSLNCLILGQTLEESFCVDIGEMYTRDVNVDIKFSDFRVTHLKEKFFREQTIKNIIRDKKEMNLYKVDSKKVNDELNNLERFTEGDIKTKLGGTLMTPVFLLERYFDVNQEMDREGIHIFIVPTSTGHFWQGIAQGVFDWNDVNSIYNWIKGLKRPNERKSKLVISFGAKFPLQGRNETLEILLNGNQLQLRNGIRQRFHLIKNKFYDKQDHHIPILANGPGTGKSRFLQELPTLMESQIRNYIDDENILESFDNRKVLFINVTFNGITNALEKEISAGPASVALRILYEHFISDIITYGHFSSMCRNNWHEFTIMRALDVVRRDIDSDINFIVLGIDELNCFHSLALAKGDVNPVKDIVRAVGSLNCTKGHIFYAPILAGTIQGPLEDMIKETKYDLLRLPLRLLSDSEVENISLHMIGVQKGLQDYINHINHSRTLNCCISDIGGQVRALEIFYKQLINLIDMDTHKVNYKFAMELVRNRLQKKYPFKEFATIMKPVVTCAILNIPVDEADKFETDDGKKVSYIDLSSKGIINLEMIPDQPGMTGMSYVRMPYIWVWITTSIKDFKAGQFWDVMIDQNSHVLWQDFEDFNMRFWVLRLQLLKDLYGTVKLQELFRGAYHVKGISLWDNKFQLPYVEEYYTVLKSQFPNEIPKKLSLGTVYKNGVGAPWNLFFFLGNFLFAIQIKSSDADQPQSLSKNMVDKEYQKVEKAFNKMQSTLKGIDHWVLLICTNEQKTKDSLSSLKENCFIVNCENFKDFYGYTFSSRAEFAAANDQLDANTAEKFELKTIRDIGDTTADKICEEMEKRPFEDEKDLYDRIGIPEQAKEKIKVVKSLIETSTTMNID